VRTGELIAGRYRLKEIAGTGGMGMVWRAVDEQECRDVALKRAAPGAVAGDDRAHRRMRREAQIAAELHHPHIVAFINEVTEGPVRWLVLEYVPSQSLAQILERAGPLLPRHVTHIGMQIASALEAVHGHGILHRDVKPGNILVTEDGTAKLTDFGISRPICGDVTVTDSAVIGGTVAFLASEVADGKEPTPASDVFALGATLFAAVEGIPPFGTSDNPLLVLRRAAAGDLLPVHRAGPLTPVLSALLQPDPANRPDAAGARQLLEELAATLGADEGPLRWPVRGLSCPRRSRRRAAYATGAVVAIVVTMAGLVAFRPGRTSPNTTAALGDAVMADPCALTDPSVLAQFGTATRDSAYGNFKRCDVLVSTKDGAQVDVSVEFEKPASPRGTREGPAPLQVVPLPENDRQCMHVVPLADQNRVTITAELQRGPRPASLCALSSAASDRVVAVLGHGEVPRRGVPPSRESLAWVNACTLLDAGI
jgi:eukaryotic-like serine/threonine-protein kinase